MEINCQNATPSIVMILFPKIFFGFSKWLTYCDFLKLQIDLFLKKKRLELKVVANGKMTNCEFLGKRVNRRDKQNEIWNLGVVVTFICCSVDLLVFKVIVLSFGALVSKWHVTRKLNAVEQKEWNLGVGCSCNMHVQYFWPFSA